jgi:RimJ/RimL family protein N-acetyltransferase
MLKESAEKGNQFFNAIRKKTDESLIGFVYFPEIAWSNGSVFMRLLIAENDDLQRYGHEVLDMTLEYIFHELNLYRVAVIVPEYNREMAELYEQVGFLLEVRMRDFYYRGGRLWDQLIYGCLLPD